MILNIFALILLIGMNFLKDEASFSEVAVIGINN